MWTAAQLADGMRLARDYGFQVSNNPKPDWSSLKSARDTYIERLQTIYHRNLATSGVTEIVGHGELVAPGQVRVADRVLSADHILIATGSTPIVPELPGAELGITSDGFFELEQQPQRVLIVGGGYIAVEFAGLLNSLGSSVTLLLRGESFLTSFDASLRETLMEEMQRAGINVITGLQLTALERDDNETVTVHGTGQTASGFDTVIWAVGRRPRTHALGLEHADIRTDERGYVVTDDFQNASAEGFYAVGDVTGRVALTPVAIAAGRRLADRLFGGDSDARLDYENIPTVVFSHPPIGTVGMSEERARELYGEDGVKVYQSRFTNMRYALGEMREPTVVKLVTVGVQEKVIGCHVIGEAADAMIQGFAVAVKMGARKADLDNTVAIHPTAAEELVTLK